jgi:hypothetical protein
MRRKRGGRRVEAVKASSGVDFGPITEKTPWPVRPEATLPVGLNSPPRRAPRRLRTTGDLRRLQRLMAHVLVRPLTDGDGLQEQWIDGRRTAEVAAEFIKPNDRMTAFDRLQLYNRMYWFRLIDCVYDDNPGLRALLGEKKFSALVRGYLAKYPSRSFSLRNLGSRLEQFIREEPAGTAPRTVVAAEVAAFEWAQTVAFDAEQRPVVTAAEIAKTPPSRLRLGLQPYVTLLALNHAVDDYVIAVKQHGVLRDATSNTPDAARGASPRLRKPAPPRRRPVWLAIHRVNYVVHYKRLDPAAFRILVALRDGRTLTQAMSAAGAGKVRPAEIQAWFTTWMRLGWFCRRKKVSTSTRSHP